MYICITDCFVAAC